MRSVQFHENGRQRAAPCARPKWSKAVYPEEHLEGVNPLLYGLGAT